MPMILPFSTDIKPYTKLFPLHKAREFLTTLFRWNRGIVVIISGSPEPAKSFAATASRELFWDMESTGNMPRQKWEDRRAELAKQAKVPTIITKPLWPRPSADRGEDL